jgi:hypothetical protein
MSVRSDVIDGLADHGYDAHFKEIDACLARNPFSLCTNCRARAGLTYVGMRSESSYRAFWSCRSCRHWTEVFHWAAAP